MNRCLYFIFKDTQTQGLLRSAERWGKTEWRTRKTERQRLSWFSSKLRLGAGRSSCVFHFRSCQMNFHNIPVLVSGPGSSVGMATELRAGRSRIESRWGRDFPPVQTDPGAHPVSCKMCTGSFPGVKCGRGVLLSTHPLLVPRSWKSRAIPLPTLWATPGL